MSFSKKTIYDIELTDKVVLLRADYNVPLTKERMVASNYRLTQSLPTIKALQERNCRIIITSHLGRPKGVDAAYSLKPVAKELGKLLKQDVTFVNDCVGESVRMASAAMKPRDILLLENVRFHTDAEKSNDEEFAKAIVSATGAQVFVQDCFGVAHRAHASVVGPAKLLPAVAGLLIEKEVDTIQSAMKRPKKPLMAIIGGAKIADKIDIIKTFITTADAVIIGGAMANTFLKAQGVEVGESLVDDEELDTAQDILELVQKESSNRHFLFYLPQDGVVATEIDTKATTRIVDWDLQVIASIEANPSMPRVSSSRVLKHEKILDIGPISSAFIVGAMQLCETVIWNGTLGVTETKPLRGTVGPFAHGTEAIINGLVGHYGKRPFSILGGGDTTSYIDNKGMNDMFNHVSTGGGASLELMSGKKLPGVECLMDKG